MYSTELKSNSGLLSVLKGASFWAYENKSYIYLIWLNSSIN